MRRCLTLLLAAMMIIMAVPVQGFAEPVVDFVAGDDALLNDGFRLTYPEWRSLSGEDGMTYSKARPNNQKDKFILFNSADTGIEWTYASAQEVARLDLWVWPAYAIKEYEVQKFNGSAWETVTAGNWNPNNEALGATSSNNVYWYSVVLDEAISTDKLRFVIKSFTDSSYGAYITEADVRETNDLNMVGSGTEDNDGELYSAYVKTAKGSARISSGNYVAAEPGSNAKYRDWASNTEGKTFYSISPDADGKLWYGVQFEKSHHSIKSFSLNIYKGTVQKFEVWCTDSATAWENPNSAEDWTKVATATGNFTSIASIDVFNAPKAEYWLIKAVDYTCEKTSEKPAIRLTRPATMKEVTANEISDFGKAFAEIFDVVTDEEKVTGSLNLPATVTTQSKGELAVTWSSDSAYVDMTTGAVTQPAEDTTITLNATVAYPGDSTVWTIPQTFVLAGPVATPTPSPSPTPTPSPSPTPTAEPTATAAPTAGPTATAAPTAEPTATAAPTAEPTAEPTAAPSEAPSIVAFEGSAKAFGNGTTAVAENLLYDNFRMTYKEWRKEKSITGLGYNDVRPSKLKDKYVHYANTDAGVEWSGSEATVKRLDLWVWPAYAIDTYEVQAYKNGSWEAVCEGDLNPNNEPLGSTSGNNTDNDNAYWYSVVLDEAVTTDKLRFVIKSFTSSSVGAYLVEADARTTNNMNLIGNTKEENDNVKFSIFPQTYKVSKSTGSDVVSPNSEAPWRGWASNKDGSTIYTVEADGDGNIWYGVRFEKSHHSINRAVLNIKSGTVKEFEIWCSNSGDAWGDCANDLNWKKVANVKGEFTDSVQVDMPSAPAAEYWRIIIRDSEGTVQLSPAELYEMNDSDLSAFGQAFTTIFATANNGDKVTGNMNFPATVVTEAGTLAVTWKSDSEAVNVTTGNVALPAQDTEVGISAQIANPNEPTEIFTVTKYYTLAGTATPAPTPTADPEGTTPPAATATPAPTVAPGTDISFPNTASVFGDGLVGEADVLYDDFRFTYYEWYVVQKPLVGGWPAARPHKNKDRFVQFTQADSGIEWTSETEQTVKRVDLWVWPARAIDTYEVQAYDEATSSWKTVKTGDFNPADAEIGNASTGSNNSYWYSAVLDEAVTTKQLRFVIKGYTNIATGAYIAEADVRNTNGLNLISVNSAENDGQSISIFPQYYRSSNTSTGSSLTPGTTTKWRGYPGSATVIPNADGLAYHAVRFEGAQHNISRAVLNIANGTATDIEVWYTNDEALWTTAGMASDEGWTRAAIASGNYTGRTLIDIPNAPAGEFWKIKVPGYTGSLQFSAELYEMATAELSSYGRALTEVFDSVCDAIVVSDHMNLAPVVNTVSAGNVSVEWSCSAPFVNVATGAVAQQTEDVEITLVAKVIDPEDPAASRIVEQNFWVRGLDTRAKVELINEGFGGTVEDTFATTAGTVAMNAGEVMLSGDATANYSVSFDDEFTFSGASTMNITLGDSTTGGQVSLKRGNRALLNVAVADNKLIVTSGAGTHEFAYVKDIQIEMMNDRFNLLLKNGNEYLMVLYKEALLASGVTDTVVFQTAGTDVLAVSNFVQTVVSADLLAEVEQQFDFLKISSYGSASVAGDLELLNSLKDITFTYSCPDGYINTSTGAVDVSVPTPARVMVTATSPGGSFTKTFNIMITGKENVLKDAGASAVGIVRGNYSASNATDDDLATEFISESTTGWTITATMLRNSYFNKIVLHESDAEGTVNGFIISISTDGMSYTNIYTGTTITDGELIDVGVQNARYIRVRASSVSGPGSGLKELSAYFTPSDDERVAYDLAEVTETMEHIQDGMIIPKVAPFGSSVTVTANSSIVSINEDGDNWVIDFGKPSQEVTVTFTVKTSYNASEATKEYKEPIWEDAEDIRDNVITPSYGGGGGGSYGGGGGGGSVSMSGGSAGFVPGFQNVPQESIFDVYKRELSGHWGANEIQTLINEGIVTGNGESLNLKGTVTRAEVLKMIMTAFGYEAAEYTGGFVDVNANQWYAGYAEVALKEGLMVGDGVHFRGDEAISRQEIAVVIVNILRRMTTELSNEAGNNFTDDANIASWAKESIDIATGLGLLKGYETGEFMPTNNLLRDEAMVIIHRAMVAREILLTEVVQ